MGGHFTAFLIDRKTVGNFPHQPDLCRVLAATVTVMSQVGVSSVLLVLRSTVIPHSTSESQITEHFWAPSVSPFMKKFDRSFIGNSLLNFGSSQYRSHRILPKDFQSQLCKYNKCQDNKYVENNFN